MIEEKYLAQAILENKANPNPDGWTCIRLAAQLYLQKELFGHPEQLQAHARAALKPAKPYAMAAPPQAPAEDTISYTNDSEFGRTIDGKRAADVWPILDELMSIVQVTTPEIYTAVLAKIKQSVRRS